MKGVPWVRICVHGGLDLVHIKEHRQYNIFFLCDVSDTSVSEDQVSRPKTEGVRCAGSAQKGREIDGVRFTWHSHRWRETNGAHIIDDECIFWMSTRHTYTRLRGDLEYLKTKYFNVYGVYYES